MEYFGTLETLHHKINALLKGIDFYYWKQEDICSMGNTTDIALVFHTKLFKFELK